MRRSRYSEKKNRWQWIII